MSEEYECIGGPLDGETMPRYYPEMIIPLPNPPGPLAEEPGPPWTWPKPREGRYVLSQYRHRGRCVLAYKWEGER